ncbi:MAG: HAD-IC family P-type ATPase [Gaiella sp.]
MSSKPANLFPAGLTGAEAARRLADLDHGWREETTRSKASIVRANVLTPFNLVLLALGVLTLAFADWRDALFLAIVVTNAGIGIWQELKAKRALDALAALVAPHARVVRDGETVEVPVDEVVPGDLVRVFAGDQVIADGAVVEGTGLMLDESILTGESHPVPRVEGEELRSGSFVVEGSGGYAVRAVGPDCYAEQLAGTAREFRHPRSPLERAVNRLLYSLVAVGVPIGSMLVVALWKQDQPIRHSVETAVAGMVTLVPEGLVLLVSLTFAAGAVRLSRRGALSQQLNAIESLASVDTLCLDKTGTLTEPELRVIETMANPGVPDGDLDLALARYGASAASRNGTIEALARAFPGEAERPESEVAFSSARRWSALTLHGVHYVLGAPEVLGGVPALERRADEARRQGRRVVAVGVADRAPQRDGEPPRAHPLGLVVLAEDLRPGVQETISFLLEEGVDLKVLSGDDPATVASIARDAGIPVDLPPVDATNLPSGRELGTLVRGASVFGRVSPESKREVIEALTGDGRYVAMIGDGVNDVPSLKASRLAIAPASGTQMARTVADIVLVRGDFAAVPVMIAEGRRILRNVQRVTKLFVTKSVFAAFLILAIGLTPTEYPLLPRHLTVIAAITVGIPAFFLALAPSSGPWRTTGFLRDVARFSVPAGVAAGLGVIVSYLVTLNVFAQGLVQARTAATSTLIVIGLYLVLALEATGARRARWVGLLCGVLFALYVAILALPGVRSFFELEIPEFAAAVMIVIGVGLAVGFLWLTDDRFVPLPSRRSSIGEEALVRTMRQ